MEKKDNFVWDMKLLARILRLAKDYKWWAFLAILCTILLAFVGPAMPRLVQYTLDNPVMEKDHSGLNRMIMFMVGLLVIQGLLMFTNIYSSNWIGQKVVLKLRNRMYRFISSLKINHVDKTPVGTLVTRNVSDIETIADVFSQGVIQIIGEILRIAVIVTIMFVTNWKLTLWSLAILPLLIWASNLFRKGVKSAFQQVRTQISNLNAFVQEHITGMEIVQIYGKEEAEYERFKTINYLHFKANKKAIFNYAVFFPAVDIITALAIATLIWYGTKNRMTPDITVGVLTAFIMYINMFFRPIRMIADRFNSLQMGIVAASRIFELMDREDLVEVDGEVEKELDGNVEFENVWFAYNEGEYVLRDISLKVNKGQTLAIVGATGAGKSSIIKIINRFYEFQKGKILLDGTEVRDLKLSSLRSQIATVQQDIFLFSGSVRDNITLNNPNITDEQITKAIDVLEAWEFINHLPEGLNYDVKERGSGLSVGQRQLISFIRALVYDPKILILDEATSSIDSETEEMVQNAISKLLSDRTAIVIAHRLSTIKTADQIIVMSKGQIVEKGTHKELVDLEGEYFTLLQKQELGIDHDAS